jgi:tRNA threonylcarbamoyladenosine biosynthesis protein TsaB
MKILAIDTSTPFGSVAVMEGESVMAAIFEQPKPFIEGANSATAIDGFSSRLFRYVTSVLAEANLGLPDIDILAVAAGPGSFTGLRVGLVAVKAWSEVYGKPIAAISALEAIAAQSNAAMGPDQTLIAAFTDARRGQVFSGLFEKKDQGLKNRPPEAVSRPEELIEVLLGMAEGKQIRLVSPTPEVLEGAILASNLRNSIIEKVSEDLAPWVGRLANGRAQRGDLVDALRLDANYVRRMDAELYWKDS